MGGGRFIADPALLADPALHVNAASLVTVALLVNVALLVAAALIRFPGPLRYAVGAGTGRGPRPAGRRPRIPGRGPRPGEHQLRPTEVALLRSGPAAAVVTALVLLHARAAVDAAAPGTVRRSGGLPLGCDPLARLIYESLAYPGGPRELATRRRVRDGLNELAAGLAGAGLVLSAGRRIALRAAAAMATLLALAALAAMAAAGGGVGGHRTLATVGLVGSVVPVAALALLPARTAAGRRLVRRLRWRLSHLAPEHEPDAAEWSPQVLGLAVALHGAAALRLTFPRFAAQGGLLSAGVAGGGRLSPGP